MAQEWVHAFCARVRACVHILLRVGCTCRADAGMVAGCCFVTAFTRASRDTGEGRYCRTALKAGRNSEQHLNHLNVHHGRTTLYCIIMVVTSPQLGSFTLHYNNGHMSIVE